MSFAGAAYKVAVLPLSGDMKANRLDIKSELNDDIQKIKNKEKAHDASVQKAKQTKLDKKIKTQELKKQAFNKLTNEERKALGIK